MEKPGQNHDPEEQPASTSAKAKAKSLASEAAAKVGIGKAQSIFTLALVSIAASLLIASYVLGVGLFMLHKKHTETVSDAAIEAARELADITVSHPTTGPLSLCRWREQGTLFFDSSREQTRSVESVERNYQKIEQLAKTTGIQTFHELVERDQKILDRVAKELREQLDAAILPADTALTLHATEEHGRGKVYQSVANLIGDRYGLINRSELDLHIRLGYVKEIIKPSNAQMFLVNPENFRPAPAEHTPNMVLISYTEPNKRNRESTSAKKETSACVYINPSNESPAPAAFVLNFPQGVPPFALRLMDYLKQASWKSKGIWHQCMDGEVPGSGHLAPPIQPLLPEMSPADALAVEIYHWLKYAGDRIDPDTIAAMFQETWAAEPSQADANNSDERSFGMLDTQVNSCIINDSGSREHALMFEGKEGESGQTALARAFLMNDNYRSSAAAKPTIPDNAFPLCVDSSGHCNIVGQNTFDAKLIADFFRDLQATNLAARETLATIKPIQQMSVQIVSQLEQKLRIEREELNSLVLRANRLGTSGQDSKLSMQRRITGDKIEDLKLLIDADTTQLNETKNAQRLCTIAKYNASRAELNTFDLNAQKLRYCRDGLLRVTNQGYLLGKNLAFKPLTKSLLESDFEQTSNATSEHLEKKSEWLSGNLLLVGSPDDVFPALSKNIGGKWKSMLAKTAGQRHFAPQMLIVDSRSILAGHKPGTKFIETYTKYPFNNIAVPQSELIYYCQTAVTTGDKPKVGWSVLARDFLANRGPISSYGSAFTFVGLPIAAFNSSWCHNGAFGGTACPRLACEFQVRTPLPMVENSFEDAYLQNAQNGQRTPLIPTVTPDML